MNFWELVLAVLVGNLITTVVALPFYFVIGVILGLIKAAAK